MGGITKIFAKPEKTPGPDPILQRQLAAAKAAEEKRKADDKAKSTEEAAQLKRNKRGRRSLFAANNSGSGFDEIEEKKTTLG